MITRVPLVAHVLYRLDYGGLENGVVNLINHMPRERYRHAIICLTTATDFKQRIQGQDVDVFVLNKREGKDLPAYLRFWRLLRRIRPDILHSRNLGTMDCAMVARLAGVAHCIHGEHGWDIVDLHGKSSRYRMLRKLLSPVIDRFVAVSSDLERWLVDVVGVPRSKVVRIANGVDTASFKPRAGGRRLVPEAFRHPSTLIFGSVGRMHPVKNPLAFAHAFVKVVRDGRASSHDIGLVMIGDGPLRGEVQRFLDASGCSRIAWLPGARDDVAEILREMDVFVLPSLNEGMSNTVLEAMASGLAVIAADVGGNSELIVDSESGLLAVDSSEDALADSMTVYLRNPSLIGKHGAAGRRRVIEEFGLESMVRSYLHLYDGVIQPLSGTKTCVES